MLQYITMTPEYPMRAVRVKTLPCLQNAAHWWVPPLFAGPATQYKKILLMRNIWNKHRKDMFFSST